MLESDPDGSDETQAHIGYYLLRFA